MEINLILKNCNHIFSFHNEIYSRQSSFINVRTRLFILAGTNLTPPKRISSEQRLLHHLMDDYYNAVRPVIVSTSTVVVGVGLTITQILDVASIPHYRIYACLLLNHRKWMSNWENVTNFVENQCSGWNLLSIINHDSIQIQFACRPYLFFCYYFDNNRVVCPS